MSGLTDPAAAFGNIPLSAFDAGFEFIREFFLVLKQVLYPLAQFFQLCAGQLANDGFDLLDGAHREES